MINIKNIVFGVGVGALLLASMPFFMPEATTTSVIDVKSNSTPSHIDLGMNGVPVLNQGQHGSCVTFAITAALDAVVNKGDYISQLCLLQLGNYLQENAYSYSGWDGSYGKLILSRVQTFGVVSKQNQAKYGCGGYKNYNSYNKNNPSYISPPEYKKLSENLITEEPINKGDVYFYSLSDSWNNVHKGVDGEKLLTDVKQALAGGDRVVSGFIIVSLNQGVAGAFGKYKQKNDSWVLGAKSVYSLLSGDAAGHEMIIIGYDDNATITTPDGIKHKGVFKLRNSWGTKVGDGGNFYMSYGYFKMFALDAIVISKIK